MNKSRGTIPTDYFETNKTVAGGVKNSDKKAVIICQGV